MERQDSFWSYLEEFCTIYGAINSVMAGIIDMMISLWFSPGQVSLLCLESAEGETNESYKRKIV